MAFVLPEQFAIGDLIVEGDFAAPVGFWGKDPGAGITSFEAALTSRDFEVDDRKVVTVDVSEAGEQIAFANDEGLVFFAKAELGEDAFQQRVIDGRDIEVGREVAEPPLPSETA